MRHEAIYALYSNVVTIDDAAGAFDADGNKVTIDESAVTAKANELLATAEIKNKIISLENEITPRRTREAILGTDSDWLKNKEAEIATERGKL